MQTISDNTLFSNITTKLRYMAQINKINRLETNKENIKSHFEIQNLWLETLSFKKSLEKQIELKEKIIRQKEVGFFMGFEPQQPIITEGLRSEKNDILWSKEKLKQFKMEQISIRRGGETTLHTPGQLVIYPVLPLAFFSLKIKDYIVMLENITEQVLSQLGIQTKRLEKYAGLSTAKGKIAFFGVHISQRITQHGLAINVNNPLQLFSAIKSCGVINRKHDSLSLSSVEINTEELFKLWTNTAQNKFQAHLKKSVGI